MTSEPRTVDVAGRIDQGALRPIQVRVAALCAVVAMLDGFDTQAIAFVAPVIAEEWAIDTALFGPVFAAGLLGLTFGALGFGLVADKIGRKKAIVISTAIFGLFALFTVRAESMEALFVYRFITGIGLGGAMPNVIALTSEYAPKRLRGTMVIVMFCGFPLGAALGGLISARLISDFGWESVFLLGGALPIALLPVLVFRLPESIRFLIHADAGGRRIAGILNQLDPDAGYRQEDRFILQEQKQPGLPLRHLFSDGRAIGTLLLWVAFFMNLLILYFLINWLPTVLQRAGFPLENAILGTVLLNAGGIAGGVLIGRLIDRRGPYTVLTVAYLGAAVFVALTGQASGSLAAALALVLLAGFCVIGAQFGANALAADFYPTAARATGIGWALGIGRIGSIIGPFAGGVLIALAWRTGDIFLVSALPALVASAAVFLMGKSAR